MGRDKIRRRSVRLYLSKLELASKADDGIPIVDEVYSMHIVAKTRMKKRKEKEKNLQSI